ncbi:MAG: glycosyltransferase family 39 protein [Patescibacteria group bacterium]
MIKSHAPAVALVVIMLVLMVGSAWNDAATVDELAHIPSGFGYITQLDYRLNPEHPPLIKAISAASAELAVRPYFPTQTAHWREEVNSQWSQGGAFLYGFENDADRIIFWSRLPLILLTVFFAWLFYAWTQKRFGKTVGLMTLTLTAFSPTLLAHGRLVTTDMGATLGFFIGIASFIAFLERPNWRRVAMAGVLFGIAQLLKFSVVLLIPVYGILLIAWVASLPNLYLRERVGILLHMAGRAMIIGLIGVVIISAVYAIFVWNYPAERQTRDTEFLLSSYGFRPAVNLDIALIKNPVTRPFAEYLLGFLMVQQRSAGGNTAYFLGTVSAAGSRWYFPVLYALKEPLAIHLLTVMALMVALAKHRMSRRAHPERTGALRRWIAGHFTEFSAFVFIVVYWAFSIRSPLNIGIRHVLPTFPFIYLLISRQIADGLIQHRENNPRNWVAWLKGVYQTYLASLPRYVFVAVLFLWLAAETIFTFPSFLSYYNQLAGGTADGWRIATDSNYDWGQDMKRLADFAAENHIPSLSLDYFGGADPSFYLGGAFVPWQSARGPAHGWFAISASTRQSAFGEPAPGFYRKSEDSYEWLRDYEPVARAGTSIFIYHLP